MNKTFILFLCFAMSSYVLPAQSKVSAGLSPVAMSLFRNIKTTLTVAEKNDIAKMSNLLLSPDKSRFMLDGDADQNYSVTAYPVDLNKDGKEEIFIMENSGYFGGAGAQFSLYAKDSRGQYRIVIMELGMPRILKTMSAGFPDILVGGPGFEQPVWRYNGKMYTFSKKVKDGSVKSMDIEEASKAYLASMK